MSGTTKKPRQNSARAETDQFIKNYDKALAFYHKTGNLKTAAKIIYPLSTEG